MSDDIGFLVPPASGGGGGGPVTPEDLGLENVDNTADLDKPISTATQAALDTKAPLASPTFTGTVTGVTKAMVGLGNVDNTSDAGKPISTATQAALDSKAPLASPTFTGTVTGVTKAMVGLSSVDNTADASKPISTATQAALDAKAPLASPAFTGTVTGISKTMVGLGNVDNTADAAKPVSTATQAALDTKAPLASPAFTGTVTGVTKAMVGLGNVDNTSDMNKPVSTAVQTALNAKAPLDSPTFTGTVSGISKSSVGLGNVDNTADASKPVSTAQAAADALRVLKAGDSMTGQLAVDVDLATYALQITNVNASGAAVRYTLASLTSNALASHYSGGTDTTYRFAIDGSGKHKWGDGATTGDTILFRQQADHLRTNDNLGVDLNLGVGLAASIATARIQLANHTTAVGGMLFGTDTNLYRSASDRLSTDDAFYVGGDFRVTGNAGFYGSTPVAKPTVTGSRGGNAALASLITALANLGLITDSTTV